MIEIIGHALSQWDVGRSVQITGIEADHAHFANKGDSKAVIMGVVDTKAKIPDYLLQTGKQLCVYAVKDGITVESKTFYVQKRERPENYVYEDDQRNYIYELITNAETAVEDANHAADSATVAAQGANTSAGRANTAADNANAAASGASEAAKNATEAAAKAAHTAKSLMVVGQVSGASVHLDDAIDQFLVGMRIFGKTTQDGTPTPDAPVELVSVGAGGSITVNVAGENEANSMTIATPNGLPGIPVSSGGNYTDANGQQWVCDEIDLARGVYVKRIGFTDLTGASWTKNDSGKYFTLKSRGVYSTAYRVLCTHIYGGKDSDGNKNAVIYINSNRDIRLNIALNDDTTEAVKNAMDGAVLIGVLATPIETPLSAEELAAYAALHTYRGNTVVSNDAGAYMDIEYVMDAKKYIDSLITGGVVPATVE